uniref:Uncharacterized protein n=2 Tax=Oryza brachyantha TaxID=4533 RepID=J3LWS7_ORYBR
MPFVIRAARDLGLRCATLWTASACGFMGYYHYKLLFDHAIFPLKSEEELRNGHLETTVDLVPGVPKDLRLRDLPSFVRSTARDDVMFHYFIDVTATMPAASAVILNTFDELDAPLMGAMAALLPPIYTVGPLHLAVQNGAVPADSPVAGLGSNLWKEQEEPLRWLDGRPPRSVVYVNFGSITVMSGEHLLEFAWGLANSG